MSRKRCSLFAQETECRNLPGIDCRTAVLETTETVEVVSTEILGEETQEQVDDHVMGTSTR